MISNPWKLFFIAIIICLITGCSDIKEIQSSSYVMALGFDFKDGKYHVYAQMTDFSSIAKQEGGNNESPKIYIYEEVGENFPEALFNIYDTSQGKVIWAHVTSIVLTEAVIKEGFQEIFDGLTRYHEFRLTPWVYGTRGSIEDIFSTTGFFNQPPTSTLLHNPKENYKQLSKIRPIKLFQYSRELYEPQFTTYLPSLKVDDEQWKEKDKKEAKIVYDGAFFVQNRSYKGFFPMEDLEGLRWVTPESKRLKLTIGENQKHYDFVLVLAESRVNKKMTNKNGIQAHLMFKGYITSRNNNNVTSPAKIERLAEDRIRKEVEDLYTLGIDRKTDILNLEHILYRDQHEKWKEIKSTEIKDVFKDISLEEIKVDVFIDNTGSLDNRKLEIEQINH
nr:Ger(x)C family spore germination protein [Bacillus pumilus]